MDTSGPGNSEAKPKKELGPREKTLLFQEWLAIGTKLDTTLITLSSGGLALLIALYTAVRPEAWWIALLYLICALLFLCAIHFSLQIFQKDAVLLEASISEMPEEQKKAEVRLKKLGKLRKRTFYCAVLLSLVAAIATIATTDKSTSDTMEQDQIQSQSPT